MEPGSPIYEAMVPTRQMGSAGWCGPCTHAAPPFPPVALGRGRRLGPFRRPRDLKARGTCRNSNADGLNAPNAARTATHDRWESVCIFVHFGRQCPVLPSRGKRRTTLHRASAAGEGPPGHPYRVCRDGGRHGCGEGGERARKHPPRSPDMTSSVRPGSPARRGRLRPGVPWNSGLGTWGT